MRKRSPTTEPPGASSDPTSEKGNAPQDDQDAPVPADTVGYGKPPTHSRFRPGASGNPAGRPRHSHNLSTLVSEELNKPVAVREGGKVRKLSKRNALVTGMVNNALQGDHRAIGLLISLVLRIDAEQAARGEPEQPLSQDDKELLAQYLKRKTAKDPEDK